MKKRDEYSIFDLIILIMEGDDSDEGDEVFLDIPQGKISGHVILVINGRYLVSRSRLMMIPPLNFAMVSPGVYRSGYPNYRNFGFLSKLGIRCIVKLSTEEPSDITIGLQNEEFVKENGIALLEFPIEGQKEPFGVSSSEKIRQALHAILDDRNHPVLVHCDKGKHRTGTVIGCLRKQQGWALSSIFDEYSRFCNRSIRVLDHQLIEFFSLDPQV